MVFVAADKIRSDPRGVDDGVENAGSAIDVLNFLAKAWIYVRACRTG